ncbi:Sugar-transfer associated ATP-grasp [anaerobic digester metagenome]
MSKRPLISRMGDFFTIVLKDTVRKSIPLIIREYSGYLLNNPSVAEQYFPKFLYRKGVNNCNDYLMTHAIQQKCWALNDRNYYSLLDNKYLFERFFDQHHINVPASVAHSFNSLVFTDNMVLQFKTAGDLLGIIEMLTGKLLESEYIFIKKMHGSGGGRNIFKVSYSSLKGDKPALQKLFNALIRSDFIFQEQLVQHEALNRLNPYCVNTLRIETFTNRQGISRVIAGNMRIGLNKAHVDNVSSGGAFIGIDMDRGVLREEAFSDFTHGRGKTHRLHPETGLLFRDYPLPYFREIIDLVESAARLVPMLRIIGWDVAITAKGPVLIEANEQPSLMFAEIGQKGMTNNPVFMEMYNEVAGKQIRF